MTTESIGDGTMVAVDRVAPGPSPADKLVEKLAERLGGAAKATAVFGDPIDREGVTVIPVAKVGWGFGGGGGGGSSPNPEGDGPPTVQGSGSGAGGGVTARPLGFIRIKDGDATFEPIKSPGAAPLFGVAAVVLATGAAIARVVKVASAKR